MFCPRRVLAQRPKPEEALIGPPHINNMKYWCIIGSVRIKPDLKKLGAHGGPSLFFSKLARQLWVILAATRTRRGIVYAISYLAVLDRIAPYRT